MADPGPGTPIELAVTYVSIVGEDRGIARTVTAGVREGQRYADRHPIKLDLDLNAAGIARQIAAAHRQLSREFDWKIDVRAEPDFSRFPRQVDQQLRNMRRLFGWSLPIPVDLDSAAALARMAQLRRELERLARPIRQNIDVDVGRGTSSRLASAAGSVGSLIKAAGAASAAVAGIAAIGGAAGTALGAVAALGVGLTALGPAAVAAGATAAVGLSGIGEAFKALSAAEKTAETAQQKAARALAELSPNARAFVLAAREAKPAWEELGDAVQDRMFDGAAAGIGDLVRNSLPTLKAGMTGVAAAINGVTAQFAGFWQAPASLAGVAAILASTRSAIDGMGPGLQQATTGFLSLGQALEPVANKVGAQAANLVGQIGQAFTTATANGQLTQLISSFGDTLQGAGQGLNSLVGGLIEIGTSVGPTLGSLLATLGEGVRTLSPELGELGAGLARTLTETLPVAADFGRELLSGLRQVLPVLGEIVRALLSALKPAIGPLSEIARIVGSALAQSITALEPAIGPLSTAFASLVRAAAQILPVIAEIASGLLTALSPALTNIFDAAEPLIKQWGELVLPVFRDLQPIIASTAAEIGTALADALRQIAPHVPQMARSFGDLVLAVAPLLPDLVRLGTQLLPSLLSLVLQIVPQIARLADAMSWLVTNVIRPLVIPALKQLADNFASSLQTAADAIRTARDFIGSALGAIGGFFESLGYTTALVWDGVVRNVARGVRVLGQLLQNVPAKLGRFDIPGGAEAHNLGTALVRWADEHRAAGGLLRGPGTGTSDSMLIAASTGEYVVNAAATAKSLPLLQAINAGWVPSAEYLRAVVPGFAEGGQVPGKKFAQSMDSATYLMGGFNRARIDCSGMVSATVNDALGLDPFAGRMSTVNEGTWLAAKGARPGLGGLGDISIGWYDNGGGTLGHTAMTLSDGTNVESNSSDGVVIGGPVGADHPMFTHQMHLPAALLRGGDLGGPATGTPAPSNTGGRSGLGTSGTGGGGASSVTPTPAAPGAGSGDAAATRVFVVNWPAAVLSVGGPAASAPAATPAVPATTPAPSVPNLTTPNMNAPAPSSAHPLANLPIPGFDKLFAGPAPWYLAESPQQAVANLGAQAANLAQSTGKGFADYFQANWKDMLRNGFAVAVMAATAPAGGNTYNFNGMDPRSAAAAVERVHRRLTLAAQRTGGFGR